MTTYRTAAGDVLRDDRGGWVDVVAVWRAEDIDRFVDARCYLHRADAERSALYGGRRIRPHKGRS